MTLATYVEVAKLTIISIFLLNRISLDDIKILLPLVNVAERKAKRQTDVYTFPINILKKFNIYK